MTSEQEWEAIAQKRRQDLKVYLALSQFHRRPKVGELAPDLKQDIKALFGSYKQACNQADQMLFSLGNPEIVAELCKQSSLGKKLRNYLLVYISALETLDPLLRL